MDNSTNTNDFYQELHQKKNERKERKPYISTTDSIEIKTNAIIDDKFEKLKINIINEFTTSRVALGVATIFISTLIGLIAYFNNRIDTTYHQVNEIYKMLKEQAEKNKTNSSSINNTLIPNPQSPKKP